MTETLKTTAMQLYQRQAFKSLKLFKKHKKKSWAALGINAEMEARINAPFKVKGTITGRLPPRRHIDLDLINTIKYIPREIHVLKAQSSHNTIAHMAQVKEQEKFRADPRFPIFQMTQRAKRYADIFKGKPYLPIFGGPGVPA